MVQTLPSQTSSPMLTGRPSSGGGYNSSPGSPQAFRAPNMGRYNQHGGSGYRGMPPSGPVAPYAFTSTPQPFNAGIRSQVPGQGQRSSSTGMLPQYQQQPLAPTQPKASAPRHQNSASTSPALSNSLSLDFSKIPALDLSMPASTSQVSLNSPASAKPSPDRYRRNVRRVDSNENGPNRVQQGSAMPSGSGMAAVGQLYNHPAQTSSSPSLSQYPSYRGSTYTSPPQQTKPSTDDMVVGRSQNAELAARYRRRSLGNIETAGLNHTNEGPDAATPHTNMVIQKPPTSVAQPQVQRPASNHAHSASAESNASTRSGRSSSRPTSARNDKNMNQAAAQGPVHIAQVAKPEIRHLNPPSRPADTGKRNPSPLSRPANTNGEPIDETPRRIGVSHQHAASSAAVEHLSAVNQKDTKKSKSKLRRAFSFGSAAELRKVTAQANLEKSARCQHLEQAQL